MTPGTGGVSVPSSPTVVVTLVHGTILLARWPWLSRTVRRLGALRPSRARDNSRDRDSRDGGEIEWYKEGSTFRRRLLRAMADGCNVTTFEWSGANSEWRRLCDAGAEHDFTDAAAGPPDPRTLRAHIAKTKDAFPHAKHVLVAHSHGGNVCLAALRDRDTRDAVHGLACLSTPFVNVRSRADSAVLMDFLQGAGFVALGVALFGSIYVVSQLIPEPWESTVWVAGSFSARSPGPLSRFEPRHEGRRCGNGARRDGPRFASSPSSCCSPTATKPCSRSSSRRA